MDVDVKPEIRVFASPDKTVLALADNLISRMHNVVSDEGVCSILLSGGSTPLPLFKHLSGAVVRDVPWDSLHVFWADERFVPRLDPASNFANAMEFLGATSLKRSQVHPIPVDYPSPKEAAEAYEHELRLWSIGAIPRFDIVLLGMGADGHTASLFPNDPSLGKTDRLVAAATSPDEPTDRVTVTLEVLNAAEDVHFLVTGANKSAAIARYLDAQASGTLTNPASYVQPASGKLSLWMDQSAAGSISSD